MDGAAVRSWALEPLSATLPYTGLSADMHHDIKLEPLVGNGECATHTLLVPETDNNTSQPERKIPDDAVSSESQDEKTSIETKLDLDPSKCAWF